MRPVAPFWVAVTTRSEEAAGYLWTKAGARASRERWLPVCHRWEHGAGIKSLFMLDRERRHARVVRYMAEPASGDVGTTLVAKLQRSVSMATTGQQYLSSYCLIDFPNCYHCFVICWCPMHACSLNLFLQRETPKTTGWKKGTEAGLDDP
jgi:hypothetical protein